MGTLKNALTAIFNANNYTSSTSGIASKKIPVTESNGLPSGQIGMSDLASVLGGIVTSYSTAIDLNDIIEIGGYFVNWRDGISNVPSGLNTSFHLIVENPVGGRLIQTIVNASNASTYKRIRKNTGDWSAWVTL